MPHRRICQTEAAPGAFAPGAVLCCICAESQNLPVSLNMVRS